jgi:hypothetical protein
MPSGGERRESNERRQPGPKNHPIRVIRCGASRRTVAAVAAAAWSAYDEGYLMAYQWAGALAAGSALPQEQPTVQLGPGEVEHSNFPGVAVFGHFGENKEYHKGFLLVGGPVGLALTGAASAARNASKKREAELAAVPRWHALGAASVVLTSQRLVLLMGGELQSLWHAECGPLQPAISPNGAPAVQFQPKSMPPLRLDFAWAPLLYVFTHHLLDGQPPAVPLPEGLLERAASAGRLAG